MHKDKPPGIFNIVDRPVGYVVRLGLLTGFVLSVFVYVSYTLVQTHYEKNNSPWAATQAEQAQKSDSP